MKNSLSFKMFLKNNSNSMATKYPFLSRSQINSRLRAEWKKISETNKQKRTTNFRNSQESTFNLNLSPNVFNGKFRSIKSVKKNTKGVGKAFQSHRSDHSKLKPLRLWSPGLQIKSEQASKSTLLQENMYDLGVDLDEYDNIDIDSLKARNTNMQPQDIEKQSFLEKKFSNCERKRTPLKKLKEKQSSRPFLDGERHGISTDFSVQSRTSLYCDQTYSKDETVSQTKQGTPVSEDELFDDYDNDNFNSYDEDDDENAVLLIRKDNCLTQVFDEKLESFNDDVTSPISNHENGNLVTEDIKLTKYQSDIIREKNNCLLESKSSSNTADSANTKHSLKVQATENIFQSKMLPTETNSTKNSSQSAKQENISTSDEKVECMAESLFHLTEESKPNSIPDVKVSPDSATSSPMINEGSTESIFYSYHDNTEDTDTEIKRTPVISHMFEEAEVKRMNSISTPSRRLLASSRFQTPSNFKMMLFDEEDIFGFC